MCVCVCVCSNLVVVFFFFLHFQTQLRLLSVTLVPRTWWSILLNAHPVLWWDGMNQLPMIILVTSSLPTLLFDRRLN